MVEDLLPHLAAQWIPCVITMAICYPIAAAYSWALRRRVPREPLPRRRPRGRVSKPGFDTPQDPP